MTVPNVPLSKCLHVCTVVTVHLYTFAEVIIVCVHCMYTAAEDNLPAISNYLRNLSTAEVTELGIQMGLAYRWLKDYESSHNFRYDVVDAWLKQQDSVADVCPPTWQNLVTALRRVDQNGIADHVTNDGGLHIMFFCLLHLGCHAAKRGIM